MEKSCLAPNRKVLDILFRTLLVLCVQLLTPASLVFAQLDGAEIFPESRFGSLPEPPTYGQRPGIAPMQAELEDSDSDHEGRGLASIAKAPKPKAKTNVRTGTQEVALIASDLGFFPKTIFVTRDIPVRLFVTGASKKPLCLMLDAFEVRKQVRSQEVEELSFVPTQPGQYRFYCPINGAEGSLFVKELSAASSSRLSSFHEPSAEISKR